MKWMKFVCCCLVVSLTLSAWPQSSALLDEQAAKVKLAVQKRGSSEHARVKVTLRDKSEVKGYITQIDADSFQVTDNKSGKMTPIKYQEVEKVRKTGLSTGAKIAIAAGVGAGVVVAVALGSLAASGE